MPFDKETWGFVEESLIDIKNRSDQLNELTSGLKIAIDSPLFDTAIESEISLIRALAFLVSHTYNKNMTQVFDTLCWYIFDNDYGKNNLQASGVSRELMHVTTYNDLKKYLEEEIEDDDH